MTLIWFIVNVLAAVARDHAGGARVIPCAWENLGPSECELRATQLGPPPGHGVMATFTTPSR